MSRGQREHTVHGRAWVAPTGTRAAYGNENNLSANARVRCEVHLTALSAADGSPVDPALTKLRADLPNWLLYVFHSAGSNDELAKHLPSRIEVSVAIGVQSRRCVALDVDSAAAELQPYREAAVEDWKHTGSALAGVRNVIAAPKMGMRALRGLKDGLRDVVSDIRSIGASGSGAPPKPSWKPEEVEQMRRQAVILSLRYQQHRRTRSGRMSPCLLPRMLPGGGRRVPDDWAPMRELVPPHLAEEADGFRIVFGDPTTQHDP
jgi:hypothetical protein